MNSDVLSQLEADERILTFDVPDEALERAATTEQQRLAILRVAPIGVRLNSRRASRLFDVLTLSNLRNANPPQPRFTAGRLRCFDLHKTPETHSRRRLFGMPTASPAAWTGWASILSLCVCGSQSSCRFCGAVFRDDERFEPE